MSVWPPTRMGVYLKAFRPRAVHNASGWGMGWFEGSGAQLVREAVRADESEVAARLADDPPLSHIFLVHVRAATVGDICEQNSHPFQAQARGKTWLFAHNGTIENPQDLRWDGFDPEGTTDSELAFGSILRRIHEAGASADVADVIHEAATELSARGRANFLLSDGEHLFAYYDGHKTLHRARRDHLVGKVTVADDEDYRIELDADAPDDHSVIVASVPLSDGGWEPFQPGELLVARRGMMQIRPPLEAFSLIAR